MESKQDNAVHLKVGSALTAIFFDDHRPTAVFCTVDSEAPLFLHTTDEVVKNMKFPHKVIFLWQDGDRLLKGESVAQGAAIDEGTWMVECDRVQWEDLERRKQVRVAAELPVTLRAVQDSHGTAEIQVFSGVTQDISVGGARVKLDCAIEAGSLVEFQAKLSGPESVRAFGIVISCNPDDGMIRISFIDYVGGSRTELDDFVLLAA